MRAGRLIAQIGPALMLAAGLGFALGAVATLDLGSARRMGPGAFPALVGGLLTVLALVCLARNLRAPANWQRPDPRAVLAVLGGVAAFAFVTPLAGVIPGAAGSVLATSVAAPSMRLLWRLALAAGVAVAVWLVFVKGLGIPLVAVRGL